MVLLMFLQEKVSEADGRRKATVPRLPLHIEAMLWNQKQEMEEKAARMLKAAAASSARSPPVSTRTVATTTLALLADPRLLAARDGRGRRRAASPDAQQQQQQQQQRAGSVPVNHFSIDPHACDDWRPARTRTRPRDRMPTYEHIQSPVSLKIANVPCMRFIIRRGYTRYRRTHPRPHRRALKSATLGNLPWRAARRPRGGGEEAFSAKEPKAAAASSSSQTAIVMYSEKQAPPMTPSHQQSRVSSRGDPEASQIGGPPSGFSPEHVIAAAGFGKGWSREKRSKARKEHELAQAELRLLMGVEDDPERKAQDEDDVEALKRKVVEDEFLTEEEAIASAGGVAESLQAASPKKRTTSWEEELEALIACGGPCKLLLKLACMPFQRCEGQRESRRRQTLSDDWAR